MATFSDAKLSLTNKHLTWTLSENNEIVNFLVLKVKPNDLGFFPKLFLTCLEGAEIKTVTMDYTNGMKTPLIDHELEENGWMDAYIPLFRSIQRYRTLDVVV